MIELCAHFGQSDAETLEKRKSKHELADERLARVAMVQTIAVSEASLMDSMTGYLLEDPDAINIETNWWHPRVKIVEKWLRDESNRAAIPDDGSEEMIRKHIQRGDIYTHIQLKCWKHILLELQDISVLYDAPSQDGDAQTSPSRGKLRPGKELIILSDDPNQEPQSSGRDPEVGALSEDATADMASATAPSSGSPRRLSINPNAPKKFSTMSMMEQRLRQEEEKEKELTFQPKITRRATYDTDRSSGKPATTTAPPPVARSESFGGSKTVDTSKRPTSGNPASRTTPKAAARKKKKPIPVTGTIEISSNLLDAMKSELEASLSMSTSRTPGKNGDSDNNSSMNPTSSTADLDVSGPEASLTAEASATDDSAAVELQAWSSAPIIGGFKIEFDSSDTKARLVLQDASRFELSSMYRKTDRKAQRDGVALHMGRREDTFEEEVIAVLFDKEKVSEQDAAKWWSDHEHRFAQYIRDRSVSEQDAAKWWSDHEHRFAQYIRDRSVPAAASALATAIDALTITLDAPSRASLGKRMGQSSSSLGAPKRSRRAIEYQPPPPQPPNAIGTAAARPSIPAVPPPPPAPATASAPVAVPSPRPVLQQRRSLMEQLFTSDRSPPPSETAPPGSTSTRDLEASDDSDDDHDELALSMSIPDVPMQRSSVTAHLRPSFVSALARADSKRILRAALSSSVGAATTAAALGMKPKKRPSNGDERSSSSSSAASGASSLTAEDVAIADEHDDFEDDSTRVISPASSSSSSSSDGLFSDEELEVEDWLAEPEDAVLTPQSDHAARRHRRGHSFSSSSSTQSKGLGGQQQHSLSLTGLPSQHQQHQHQRLSLSSQSNAQSFSSLFSGGSPDEPEDELDELDEPMLSEFLRENLPVYEVMKQVQLFRNLSQTQQEQVLRALKPAKFAAGEVIVQQGTRGSRFYMIARGEAVVTKRLDGAEDRMVTHLHAGHYFGELALIYDDPRTATVTAVDDVELLYLTQEDFQRIGQVHLSLMLQQVPLLARLSARDQDIVLSRLQPANFQDGEYIVRQGEEGTRFYMITRGEAVVTERDLRKPGSPERELTRLYEGHVFGEMSLIYSEPRTASVRAVGPVKCLYLSKADFDQCLLSERFQRFIQEAYVAKATRRAMRLRLQKERNSVTPPGGSDDSKAKAAKEDGADARAKRPTSPVRATETQKLVKQRLKNGQKVVNKYVIKGDLGKGTFGRVKLCQSEDDGKLYAVKILHKTFVQRMCGKEDQLYDALRREVAIMKKLSHRNVVRLVEVIDDPSSQKMYLVQEYVQHNLMDLVTGRRTRTATAAPPTVGLSEDLAWRYMRDLLRGLQYLHAHKVIHRDLKPENILVGADGVAKIADFGTARVIMHESETLSGAKGTPAFMAPEMFDVDATYQGPAVDIWSLGATLFMMVIGRPPWLADNEIVLAQRVQHDELVFPPETERVLDPHLRHLVSRMLTKDPRRRISLADCLAHDWITKEGSAPLAGSHVDDQLTVSREESDCAIHNIPECIDQSLSASLEQAHFLVKARLQQQQQQQQHATAAAAAAASSFHPSPLPLHPTGAGHVRRGSHGSTVWPPAATSASASVSTPTSSTSSSPSRTSADDSSRIIRAWRHHKRVQLMYGHKELSARSRELLLEQKRIAFSADRAKVTEIILPATPGVGVGVGTPGGAGPPSTARPRHMSSSAVSLHKLEALPPRDATAASLGLKDRRMSSPTLSGLRSNSSTDVLASALPPPVPTSPALGPKRDSASSVLSDGPAGGGNAGGGEMNPRTSFTSVTMLSEEAEAAKQRGLQGSTLGSSSSLASSVDLWARESVPDEDLMKRPLSRKKDFLMVTSEVFRDEDGDFQTRKILFQARDHDFSVASRAPAHSKSGRDLGRNSSATLKAGSSTSSRRSMESRNPSASSISSASSRVGATEIDLDGLDCVDVDDEDDDDEEDDDEEEDEQGSAHRLKARGGVDEGMVDEMVDTDGGASSSSDESDYSDVEADVDVDETFHDLIAPPSSLDLVGDDDEIAPLDAAFDPATIVQAYVSSKRRENLTLGIRSGYAEAKGSRSYMEDKSLGLAECDLAALGPAAASTFASLAFFGIYDGHNGDATARLLQQRLHRDILSDPQFAEDPVAAIRDVCERVDLEILDQQNRSVGSSAGEEDEDSAGRRSSGGGTAAALQPISFSGAAAALAVLARRQADDRRETLLYVANVGDCRAVLGAADGTALDVTWDHKAAHDGERARIEASGGFVHNGRLDGILAISRGFGDLAHKHDGHLIATPDVYARPVGPDDAFLLLASDGLFDVLTSQQAVTFISRKLRAHGDVQLAAQELVLKAQQYYAHDNISVIIVALNQEATEL
ncbi:hypothetical protein ATCC90586_001464 [Pythium insidiosum]|nr:hypothetical protein ATCC90586_001464 [Pythium insidiosum]